MLEGGDFPLRSENRPVPEAKDGTTELRAATADPAKIAAESTATIEGNHATHDSLVSGH
jgi:hypothetical protein